MKKIFGTIMCLLIMLCLTACGSEAAPILDENGDIIHYSEEEISPDMYYIMKDDGMYYQILNAPIDEDSLGTKYSWFCEPYDAAIPHFTSKDRLMFYSETDRPQSLTLYKMTDYAYTLGIMFSVENDTGDLKHPQVIGFADVYNGQSPVGSVIENVLVPNSTTYITGINNHEFTGNLLVDDSFLKGLTKDTMYQIEFYCGTVRKTVNVKADTHLFLQEATYTTSSYEELKSKVFEIYLPQNLAPGYYYAEGAGMFYFEGKIDDLDDDDIESLLESQNEDESNNENLNPDGTYGDVDEPEVISSENNENLPEGIDVVGEDDSLSDLNEAEDELENLNNEEPTDIENTDNAEEPVEDLADSETDNETSVE